MILDLNTYIISAGTVIAPAFLYPEGRSGKMDPGIREAETMQQTVVRATIGGSVLIIRVGGPALKFIEAAVNGTLGTSGMMNLKAMLETGKELRVLPIIGTENYRKFSEASKEYGVKYAVIKRRDEDMACDMYEVMVFASDASKVARIIEKYGINVPARDAGTAALVEGDPEETVKTLTKNRDIVSKMMSSVNGGYIDITNPLMAPEGENLYGASSKKMNDLKSELESIERKQGISPTKRVSVRKEMNLLQQLAEEGLMDNEKRIKDMFNPSDATNEDRIPDVKEVAQIG